MKKKIINAIVFIASVVIFTLLSGYRFGDSGHAIGLISINGGSVRHPVHIQKQYNNYSVIVTARVLPPYHGNAKVVLEGWEKTSYEVYLSKPVIDLGIKSGPRLDKNILYGLKPHDKIALWILMEDTDEDEEDEIEENSFNLALYDTKTERPVLQLPIYFEEFKEKEAEENDDEEQCH